MRMAESFGDVQTFFKMDVTKVYVLHCAFVMRLADVCGDGMLADLPPAHG